MSRKPLPRNGLVTRVWMSSRQGCAAKMSDKARTCDYTKLHPNTSAAAVSARGMRPAHGRQPANLKQ